MPIPPESRVIVGLQTHILPIPAHGAGYPWVLKISLQLNKENGIKKKRRRHEIKYDRDQRIRKRGKAGGCSQSLWAFTEGWG